MAPCLGTCRSATMLAPRQAPHCPCTGPSLAAPGDPPRVAWVEHGHSMVPTAVGTPRAQGRAAPTQAPRWHGSGPPSGPHPPRDTGPCPAPSSSRAPIRGGEFAASGTALPPPKHVLHAFQKGGLKLGTHSGWRCDSLAFSRPPATRPSVAPRTQEQSLLCGAPAPGLAGLGKWHSLPRASLLSCLGLGLP